MGSLSIPLSRKHSSVLQLLPCADDIFLKVHLKDNLKLIPEINPQRDYQKLCCIGTILLTADKPDDNLGHGQARTTGLREKCQRP